MNERLTDEAIRPSRTNWLRHLRDQSWTALVRVGPTLTVLALLLAALQTYQATQQGAEIREIAEAISTQYVGTFPDNLEPIAQLVASTRQSLWIVSDVPAYGHFSQPRAHAAYRGAIEDFLTPQGNKELRILNHNGAARRTFAKEQIVVDDVEGLQTRDAYNRYYPFWPTRAEPIDLDGFFGGLEAANIQFLRRLRQLGIEAYETTTKTPLPVFVWLSDDRHAIFSFFNYGANAREVSF